MMMSSLSIPDATGILLTTLLLNGVGDIRNVRVTNLSNVVYHIHQEFSDHAGHYTELRQSPYRQVPSLSNHLGKAFGQLF